jgi:galactonate dehydratase
MKITAMKTFAVPPRWLFLKIETDEGLAGWGEPVLEGRAATLAVLVEELADFLIGRDPRSINDIWQMLYRNGCYRGGPVLMSAIAGIDMALWDILGKFHGAAVHALLGGRQRDRIKTYIWIGGDRPSNLVAEAQAALARGFSAVKMNVCEELAVLDNHKKIDVAVRRLATLREAVGESLDLALDFHGRVHWPMARVLLKELEPIRPMFVEDAVTPHNIEALAELSRATSIPLAVGERMHARGEFKALFEARAAQLINPDPAHVGGITETIKIGAMAEAYDIALAPHCPLGPIALAACLQIDAVCYTAVLQEQSLGIHYNQGTDLLDYLMPTTGFEYRDGFLSIPTGPGLGVEVNEAKVIEAAKSGHRWRAPVWRHEDGAIAEW